jgi:protein-disulfide isomerase
VVSLSAARRRSSTGSIWLVAGVGIVFVGGLIGLSLWSSYRKAANAPINLPEIKTDAELAATGMALGSPDATVELVEWGDYLCPGCGTSHLILEPEFTPLIEAGEMRFVFKDFVLDGHRPWAQWAAEAAHCAADQGMFWTYRSTLFHNQKQWTKNDLKRYAAELGLDTVTFNQCVDSEKHKAAVDASTAEAESLALRGTPTFMLNGEEVSLEEYGTVAAFMGKLREEIDDQ